LAGHTAAFDEWATDAVARSDVDALLDAVRCGARVCGLLWLSHPVGVRPYHVLQNRRLAADLRAVGAEVLLDQRIRPLGSHHQKLVVIRNDRPPRRRRARPRRHVLLLPTASSGVA
jgi:hypothetical protein